MFIEVLSLIAPNRIFNHCLEWCSGPGFIGFSLLGKGLCKQLDLADIWQPALSAANAVKAPCNVDTWHIRNLCDIQPPRMYDLIVANPPWWPGNLLQHDRIYNRLGSDPGQATLKKFLIDAKNYLTPDGLIVLSQGQSYTGPKDILNALADTGFELTQVLDHADQWHWFVGIEHKRDFEAGEKV
jgi:methylase of polypeptide subunit release factors